MELSVLGGVGLPSRLLGKGNLGNTGRVVLYSEDFLLISWRKSPRGRERSKEKEKIRRETSEVPLGLIRSLISSEKTTELTVNFRGHAIPSMTKKNCRDIGMSLEDRRYV